MTFLLSIILFIIWFIILFLADRLQEAGYFYFISQGSELTVTFVPIRDKQKWRTKPN